MTSVCDPRAWKTLLESDFNRGYLAALALVLALVVALLILKFIVFLIFRTRRASSVTVKSPDGDIVVSRDALEEAITRELEQYPELYLRKLRMFRRGKEYILALFCEFRGTSGVPDVAERLRPQLKERLKQLFGLEALRSIRIVVEKLAVPIAERGSDKADDDKSEISAAPRTDDEAAPRL